jgi:ATP-dependent RNA helicase SUPV3L1/SUV3
VRTLAYVANRPDWLADAAHWREVTRGLEERLSDALHEKLMARFIDRRTSALVRGLGRTDDLLAGVASDGTVTVEGQFVGRLRGLRFDAARGSGALEVKALRGAAQRAVAPELGRRLGQLAAEADEAFTLEATGDVLWRGEAAGVLAGDQPFNPVVRLHGDLGPPAARERAVRRLEAFVAAQASRRLWALKGLGDAVAAGTLKGLARGVAYRLIEAGGVLDRRVVEADLGHLSRAERRALRGLGVRFGEFCLFLPSQTSGAAREVAVAFARQAAPDWRPPEEGLVALPSAPVPARALGLRGLMAVGGVAAPALLLERLGEALRTGAGGGLRLTDAARSALELSEADANRLLRGLGFVPMGKGGADESRPWRRRAARTATPVAGPAPSAFAALAALKSCPRPARRRRAPRPARAPRIADGG